MENTQNQNENVEVNNVEVNENVETTENVEVEETLEEKITKLEQNIQELLQMKEEQKEIKEQSEQNLKDAQRLNMTLNLQKYNLEVFDGLFELETNEERAEFINNAVNQILVSKSYIPKEVAKQDEYTQAIEQKDVGKALGFKFSKLFGK